MTVTVHVNVNHVYIIYSKAIGNLLCRLTLYHTTYLLDLPAGIGTGGTSWSLRTGPRAPVVSSSPEEISTQ